MPRRQNRYFPQISRNRSGKFRLGVKSRKNGIIGWFTDLTDMKIRGKK